MYEMIYYMTDMEFNMIVIDYNCYVCYKMSFFSMNS